MNGHVIHGILSRDPYTSGIYQGFSTPDLPIKPKTFPALFILNTDSSKGPGKHWCVAFFPDEKTCEFFDPLGFSPADYKFDKPLFNVCDVIHFNGPRAIVQYPLSSTCGHHCLFYALNRARGLSSSDILSLYSEKNLRHNDFMVYKFVIDNFGFHKAQVHVDTALYFI